MFQTQCRPSAPFALCRLAGRALLLLALLGPGLAQAQVAPPGVPAAMTRGPSVGTLPSLLGNTDPITTSRAGSATAAEGGPIAVGPIGDPARVAGPATVVFGAALFTRAAASATDTPNPNYVIRPGDRISVTVWGFVEASVVGVVDPEGNLFLPQIGPIRMAGTRAGDVQRVVEAEVRRVYSQQVQVYAVLLNASQVGVFVAGYVRLPGRHLGAGSDSILDYLTRAGGVDPGRGSYRDIAINRGGRTVARVDLYRFLLTGQLPNISLQEGDTVVVAPQGAMVGADGAVRNNFLFEVSGRTMAGDELLRLASPLPSATNAVVRGTRNGQPFARYATVRELARLQLLDQDTVTFITDAPA
ncbi:MAG: polysialic acid transport protein KpsD, partial [Rhodospirillales bacterium 12-71-4]